MNLDPKGFKELVNGIRQIEKSLGTFEKEPTKSEKENIFGIKRSLVYRNNLSQGTILSLTDFAFKRQMKGLPPNDVDLFIGKQLEQDVARDELASLNHING